MLSFFAHPIVPSYNDFKANAQYNSIPSSSPILNTIRHPPSFGLDEAEVLQINELSELHHLDKKDSLDAEMIYEDPSSNSSDEILPEVVLQQTFPSKETTESMESLSGDDSNPTISSPANELICNSEYIKEKVNHREEPTQGI